MVPAREGVGNRRGLGGGCRCVSVALRRGGGEQTSAAQPGSACPPSKQARPNLVLVQRPDGEFGSGGEHSLWWSKQRHILLCVSLIWHRYTGSAPFTGLTQHSKQQRADRRLPAVRPPPRPAGWWVQPRSQTARWASRRGCRVESGISTLGSSPQTAACRLSSHTLHCEACPAQRQRHCRNPLPTCATISMPARQKGRDKYTAGGVASPSRLGAETATSTWGRQRSDPGAPKLS